MRRLITVMAMSLCFISARAEQAENTMLNLLVPSGLEQGQAYFNIGHKYFYNLLDYKSPDEDVFAPITAGANINIGFRYMIWNGIEAGLHYNGAGQEKRVSLSWSTAFEMAAVSVYSEFFSYRESGGAYANNLFALVSGQSMKFFDVLSFTLNLGYDGYNEKPVAGAGASATFMEKYSVMAEFYPVFKDGTGGYCFGFKAVTYGHQFVFFAGNTAGQGPRNTMLSGSSPESLYMGFNIQRLIEF